MGSTPRSMQQRIETDQRVIEALASGPLTQSEIIEKAHIARSTIWACLTRLMEAGDVRESESDERRYSTRGNHMRLYELGEGPMKKQLEPDTPGVFRHWQDRALFGDYARAA